MSNESFWSLVENKIKNMFLGPFVAPPPPIEAYKMELLSTVSTYAFM
jgi:hypothetical protein